MLFHTIFFPVCYRVRTNVFRLMFLAHVLQYDLTIKVSVTTTMLVCPFNAKVRRTLPSICSLIATHQVFLEFDTAGHSVRPGG